MSGSAPVHPTTSLYGSFAYGRPKITDFAGGAAYAFNGARSHYLLTEMGLAFPLGAMDQSMTGFVVTAGYRYQRIGAKVNTGNFSAPELYETAQGPVIGMSYSH